MNGKLRYVIVVQNLNSRWRTSGAQLSRTQSKSMKCLRKDPLALSIQLQVGWIKLQGCRKNFHKNSDIIQQAIPYHNNIYVLSTTCNYILLNNLIFITTHLYSTTSQYNVLSWWKKKEWRFGRKPSCLTVLKSHTLPQHLMIYCDRNTLLYITLEFCRVTNQCRTRNALMF